MTEVQRIILKHYGKGKYLNNRGWEQCGIEIQNLIRKKVDRIRDKGLHYIVECDAVADVTNRIDSEYESYFKVGNMYVWVNGNIKLKELVLSE